MELKQFIVFATFFCILRSATGQRLLPCDSTFRFLRPDLFDHCTTCRHSDWTEWKQVPNSVGVDKSGKCPSGQAYTESRRQYSLVVSCKDNIQTRSVCKSQIAILNTCMYNYTLKRVYFLRET